MKKEIVTAVSRPMRALVNTWSEKQAQYSKEGSKVNAASRRTGAPDSLRNGVRKGVCRRIPLHSMTSWHSVWVAFIKCALLCSSHILHQRPTAR